MKECSECGKKIEFFKTYSHPILGKKYYVCANCYNFINKGLEYYKKCLYKGRENHKKDCYFWDKEKKRCKNEKYFKAMKKEI